MYSSRLPRQAEIDAAASCDRQLVSLFTVTTLAAIGDIARFPSAEQLVGYAGLGAKVHASGQAHWSERITKSGRKDRSMWRVRFRA